MFQLISDISTLTWTTVRKIEIDLSLIIDGLLLNEKSNLQDHINNSISVKTYIHTNQKS